MTFFISDPKLPGGPPRIEGGQAHRAQRAATRPVPVRWMTAPRARADVGGSARRRGRNRSQGGAAHGRHRTDEVRPAVSRSPGARLDTDTTARVQDTVGNRKHPQRPAQDVATLLAAACVRGEDPQRTVVRPPADRRPPGGSARGVCHVFRHVFHADVDPARRSPGRPGMTKGPLPQREGAILRSCGPSGVAGARLEERQQAGRLGVGRGRLILR